MRVYLSVFALLWASLPATAQVNNAKYQGLFLVGEFGELYAALGLLLGLTTRFAASVSFFILFNLAIGGYYDASLLPFFILNIVFLWQPSGLWLGLDRLLNRRYPNARWFK
jgi:hypothetical protein